ncbi:MAG: tail fiber domain-containing protein [Saprospiraceae bacterium]
MDDWLRIRGNTDGNAWSLGVNGPSVFRGKIDVKDSGITINQDFPTINSISNSGEKNGLTIFNGGNNGGSSSNIYMQGCCLSFAYNGGSYVSYIGGNGDYVETSDVRLKFNIQTLDQQLNKIINLRPVSYNYKNDKNGKAEIGFIAQEVQQLFPEFVATPGNDTLGLSYAHIGVIAIQGIKEQQQIIESLVTESEAQKQTKKALQNKVTDLETKVAELHQLLERVTALESNLQSCCLQHNQTPKATEIGTVDHFNTNRAQLQQNFPNPFDQQTEIQYYLPTSVKTAQLLITDLQGRTLKTYDLNEQGIGKVGLSGGQFAAGTYVYSLVIDGEIIDTKQMVLTK